MGLAVALQVAAVVLWVAFGFVLAGFAGAGMAAAVPVFLVGWQLEQRR